MAEITTSTINLRGGHRNRYDYLYYPRRSQRHLISDISLGSNKHLVNNKCDANITNTLKTNSLYKRGVKMPTLPRQQKSKLLMRQVVKKPTYHKKHTHKLLVSSLTILALISIAGGLYLSLIGLKANHIATIQASNLIKQANATVSDKPTTTTSTTSTPPVPSTKKPSSYSIMDYKVGPQFPRFLIIPKLHVFTRILNVGVTKSGAIGTPTNVFDTAWYNRSALPGQPGAMLIDGHVSSWTSKGVFYGLKTLVAGDIIQVQRGDGKVFTYKVVRNQIYQSDGVNMSTVLSPVTSSANGLNLITCTGDVIPGTSEFNQRIVVFAEQV